MRMVPSRLIQATPLQIKRGEISHLEHVTAPIKGLTLVSHMIETEPDTATVLDNWIVREDRIAIRPGSFLLHDHYPSGTRKPISQLMPYYAAPEHLLAATNHNVVNASTGAVIRGGFTSDDWHWSMFADLGQNKFLVMVNGAEGVWSYDGGTADPSGPIAVTSLSNTNPAQCTVASGSISKFTPGMRVVIAGADANHIKANGWQTVGTVGTPTNTFTLVGVDLTTAAGAQTSGVTADPQAGLVKEDVRAGTNMPFCNPDTFHVVTAHINRLYFADPTNLAVYYLPLQSKGGATTGNPATDPGLLKHIPMNAIFRRGGTIKAIASWTIDGGFGPDDKLVVMTSNGEVAVYSGIDPAADANFGLLGVFRVDPPMSKYCLANYGGELWVLTANGLAPMSVLMRAETQKLTKADKGIIAYFHNASHTFPLSAGWYLILDCSSGRMICNMPRGTINRYEQMVRQMPDPIWARWRDLPARCWAWIGDKLFCGSDNGMVWEVSESYRADQIPATSASGVPITAKYRGPWSHYKYPGVKHFKLLKVYAQSIGGKPPLKPKVDMGVDYLDAMPQNTPDVLQASGGTPWGSPWGSPWAGTKVALTQIGGVGRKGLVGAPMITVQSLGASYEVSGFDIVFEEGAVV